MSDITTVWEEVKKLVAETDVDVQKNSVKHNCSAGVRVRHGARALAKLCRELTKATLEADKAVKESRATKRAAAKAAAPAATA